MAQVNGRSFIPWEKVFEYDIKYVENINLKQDILIIMATVSKVIRRKDIADVSKTFIGKDGEKYLIINGKEYSLHKPLDEERKKWKLSEYQ